MSNLHPLVAWIDVGENFSLDATLREEMLLDAIKDKAERAFEKYEIVDVNYYQNEKWETRYFASAKIRRVEDERKI